MVDVEIRTPPTHRGGRWQTIARLRVDGDDYTLTGDPRAIDLEHPVLDRRTRRALHFDEDREQWARSLPTTYRGPERLAVVVADSDPAPRPQARAPQAHVRLPGA